MDSQWKCITCSYLNSTKVYQCEMCHNPNQPVDTGEIQRKCLFCNFVIESETTTCSQCQNTNVHLTNINQLCLCGRKLIKYPHDWTQCNSCCKVTEKNANTYYYCNAKQCPFREMQGNHFKVCNACYESINDSNIESTHSFLFCKIASFVDHITKETLQCQNNNERRKYMYGVYQLLYQGCIVKLQQSMDEIEHKEMQDMFDAFYERVMGEIQYDEERNEKENEELLVIDDQKLINDIIKEDSDALNTANNNEYQSMLVYLGATVPKRVYIRVEGKARGNIYISPAMLNKMACACSSGRFIIDPSDEEQNQNLAYNYFNDSIGMQSNDKQIKVFETALMGLILFANVDVLNEEGDVLYVVASRNNDLQYQARWNVLCFKTAKQISEEYNIAPAQLPVSSRVQLEQELVSADDIPVQIVNEARYKQLTIKVTNRTIADVDLLTNREIRRQKKHKIKIIKQIIDEETFKVSCQRSWDEQMPFLPVIVVNNGTQWMEYKKYIRVHGKPYCKDKHFAISIRFVDNKWKICCIDTNNTLVYYQHRLMGSHSKHLMKYEELLRYSMIDDLFI
eukprot:181575_1